MVRPAARGLLAVALCLACEAPGQFRPDVGFAPNAPPAAADDTAMTMSARLAVIDLVANDSDPDGDPLYVEELSRPANGNVDFGDGSTAMYRSVEGFVGEDSFTYRVGDGRGGSASGTVRITVTAGNSPPIGVPDEALAQQGESIQIDVLANDSDPDMDRLSLIAVDAPANGTATDARMGRVSYAPRADFFGVDSFSYSIEDARGLRGAATITVAVNGRPRTMDDATPVRVGVASPIAVLANDTDPDRDALMIAAVSMPASGMATIEAGGQRVVYTPNMGFIGADSFNYDVVDARGGTARAMVAITVSSPPRPMPDTARTQQGVAVDIPVLANDSDPENDPLRVTMVSMPQSGVATINPDRTVRYAPIESFSGNDSFVYTVDDGNLNPVTAMVTVDVNGRPVPETDMVFTPIDTPIDVDVLANDRDPDGDPLRVTMVAQPGAAGMASINMNGTVRFAPAAGFRGSTRIDYTVADGRGGTAVGRIDAVINGPPVTVDDQSFTQQGAPVDIDVLANDTDPENNMLVVSMLTQGANGTVTVNANRTVRYAPNAPFFGTDSFTYVADDGRTGRTTGRVQVAVNGRPIATNDTMVLAQGRTVTIDVLANDRDPENETLSITAVTQVFTGTVTIQAGRSLRYAPNPGYFGVFNLTYTIRDTRMGTAAARVDVTVNGNTTAGADTALTQINTPINIDVVANDTDPEGDMLTVTRAGPAPNGNVTINPNNTVRFDPRMGYNGTDRFNYTVSDGRGTTATGTVTVRVNAPPIVVADVITVQQEAETRLAVRANDRDPDADAFRIVNVTAPLVGVASSTAGDVILYRPPMGYFGNDALAYTVDDGFMGSATTNVTVQVNGRPTAVNDMLLAQRDTDATVNLIQNDQDPENDTLTVAEVTQGASGTVTITGAETVRYRANMGFFGFDQFTYTLSDGRGGRGTATVNVDVNAPPIVVADVAIVLQNTPSNINVLANDLSPDFDLLILDSVTRANNGDVAVNPDNSLRYTPANGFTGQDQFSYTLRDGRGGRSTGMVSITVVRRPQMNTRVVRLTGIADAFGLAVGDLNQDGLADTVLTNRRQDTITAVLNLTANNDNDPTFGLRFAFTTGAGPEAVAVGDLNGDNRPDAVSANTAGGNVSVLLNQTPPAGAQPAFAAAVNLAAGTSPVSVVLADLNRDNRLDVAVGNGAANTVTVLLNTTPNGAQAPSFAPAASFAATAAGGIAAADLNGDGALDLVVTARGQTLLSVLLNTTPQNGTTATFGMATTFATGTDPYLVATNDLNGDARPDLVVSNRGSQTVGVLINTTAAMATTPSFEGIVQFTTGQQPTGVAVVDFNGDGRRDVAVSNFGDDSISVLINQTPAMGALAFANPVNFPADDGPFTIVIADINTDLLPDIVVADANAETVSALINRSMPNGAAAFPGFGATRAGRSTPVHVAIADLTRDGIVDAVTLDRADRTFSVFGNTSPMGGAIGFATRTTVDTAADGRDLVVGDLNRDGLADVVVMHGATARASVFINTTASAGTSAAFAAATTVNTGMNPVRAALADLNRDGQPDLVVVNRGSDSASVFRNTTAMGQTAASFAAPVTLTTGLAPSALWVGDLNGDGNVDVAVTNFNQNSVSVFLNTTPNGGATFTFAAGATFAVGVGPMAIAGGDFNGNGRADLVTLNQGDSTLTVLDGTTMMGGAPSFDGAVTALLLPNGSELDRVVVADLNGDGRLDLVGPTSADGAASPMINLTVQNTAGYLFAAVALTAGDAPSSVAVGDFNRDGNQDLATANADSDDLVILVGP